jgi:nicotinate phosphoribosyltransferase
MDDDALLTDLYELHMMQAYQALGMCDTAVFDLIVRRLPEGRNFLVAAGLEQVLDYLARLHFTDEALAWLEGTGKFSRAFLRSLAGLRFTGCLDAVPEGTVLFAGEPVLRIAAPIGEAQLVESRIINLMQLPMLVASKAVRCVLAARGRTVIDFGLRRAHGAEAALLGARACCLAGYDATATVAAGQRYGIPVAGTLAHAFIQAHDSEEQAFAGFVQSCGGGCTMLVDTYDVPRALERVARLARTLREHGGSADGGRIEAVRIDSGDLAAQACMARGILDTAGCGEVKIAVSGDLDEYRIAELVAAGAPIDIFGVGSRVATAADAPYLDCAYKLAEYAGLGRRKRSPGKESWPGRKQVYRCQDDDGILEHDTIGLETEPVPGRPLLEPVMRRGERTCPHWSLAHMRQTLRTGLASLPQGLLGLAHAEPPLVRVSSGLRELAQQVDFHPS